MLNENEVEHVADLAKLYVYKDEYPKYQKQLHDILSEIKKIEDIDIDGDIMISPSSNTNEYSNDNVGPMLNKDDIFKNVKHTNGDYIVVPTVIND